MSLKNLFQRKWKNESESELKRKMKVLEINLNNLKAELNKVKEIAELNHSEKTKEPPIIIEKINVEKIIFDKYELNNNFGQLGIKELKGKLNIGATYGSEFTPISDEESEEGEREKEKEKLAKKPKNGPKINIQTKKD